MKVLPGGVNITTATVNIGIYCPSIFLVRSGPNQSLLDGHVPRGLDYMTVHYSIYPVSGKYPALVEYLKIDPDPEKLA